MMSMTMMATVLAALGALAHGNADPKANPAAIVEAGHARFTVLTEQLVRMEWTEDAAGFRDTATLVFNNRRLEVPPFKVSKKGSWMQIETAYVKVQYDTNSQVSFSDVNLNVEVKSISPNTPGSATWKPSLTDKDSKRLYGSLRTLDMTNGTVDLDCNTGGPDAIADSHCTYGLISRSGYVVVDDSLGTELDNDPWPWLIKKNSTASKECSSIPKDERRVCGYNIVTQDQCDTNGCCFDEDTPLPNGFSCFYGPKAYQDLYFFGHGHRYKQALKEFTLVAGSIPLPPKFAFGVFYSRWWAYNFINIDVIVSPPSLVKFAFGVFYSRWWAYNDVDIDEIANEYQVRSIPLDVVVLDMDWHLTFYKNTSADQSGQPKGWTGYTWNKELFPDPEKFLAHLHSLGLHVTANLHPASGVQPWEDSYESVAKAMGIDPRTQKYVPFDLTNKQFAINWLKYSLKPREQEGIDFWWLDWQQGEDWFLTHNQASPNLNPTIWLNHVFFTNPQHWNDNKRPVLLHRFGGLGNHRYPLGFSGDVVPSWQSLDFQPFFTSMASNVGFTYWSHDIGGFQHGNNPELYTRWIQWGVFSPVLRTHSTKDNESDRRIWTYPNKYYEIMRAYLNLRRELTPYIYTQARLTHESGLGFLHGLYFEWPELDEAYQYSRQYLFGTAYLVAPIATPVDPISQLAKKSTWLPPGIWFDTTLGSLITGPVLYSHSYTLNELPLFARAGSIIPFAPSSSAHSLGQAQSTPDYLTLSIIPGTTHGHGALYEDAENTQSYLQDEFAWTTYTYDALDSQLVLTIHPVNGTYPNIPTNQKYLLEFRHAVPAKSVTINGQSISFFSFDEDVSDLGWKYDASRLAIQVYLKSGVSTSKATTIRLVYEQSDKFSLGLLNGVVGGFSRVQQIKSLLDLQPVYAEDYPHLRLATGTSRRIAYNVSSFFDELTQWTNLLQLSIKEVQQLKLSPAIKSQILATLQDSIIETSGSPMALLPDNMESPFVFVNDDIAESFVFS